MIMIFLLLKELDIVDMDVKLMLECPFLLVKNFGKWISIKELLNK